MKWRAFCHTLQRVRLSDWLASTLQPETRNAARQQNELNLPGTNNASTTNWYFRFFGGRACHWQLEH
jgi:hypothetical protein